MSNRANLFEPLAISTESTIKNKTGSWRFERPVFMERIAPCNEACPLGQDINAILALQAGGDLQAALNRMLMENPFPGLCGRICPAICERACNRGQFDQPVSIKALELFAAATAEVNMDKSLLPRTYKNVAVVGNGPGIWSAAWFLFLLGHTVVVFTETTSRKDFDYSEEWAEERDRLMAGKVQQNWGPLPRIEDLLPPTGDFDAVLSDVATSGEQANRVVGAREFRRLLKENPGWIGRRPAIVGHGEKALKTAALLRDLNVGHTILSNSSPPDDFEQTGLSEMIWKTDVLGLVGDTKGLSGLLIRQENKESELDADQVIIALGQRNDPLFETPRFISNIPFTRITGEKGKDPNGSIIERIAVAKGAAMGLDLALNRRPIQDIARCFVGFRGAVSFEAYLNPNVDYRRRKPAILGDLNLRHFDKKERLTPDRDIFSLEQALASAARCFNCGLCTYCGKCDEFCPDLSIDIDSDTAARFIDYEHCKGCGICVEECPHGAIDWVPE